MSSLCFRFAPDSIDLCRWSATSIALSRMLSRSTLQMMSSTRRQCAYSTPARTLLVSGPRRTTPTVASSVATIICPTIQTCKFSSVMDAAKECTHGAFASQTTHDCSISKQMCIPSGKIKLISAQLHASTIISALPRVSSYNSQGHLFARLTLHL